MKKYLKFFTILLMLSIPTICFGQRAQYMPDLIVTEPGAAWTDLRQFASLSAAVTAIGATQSTLLISEDTTMGSAVTIPSNVVLKFTKGSVITLGNFNLVIQGYVDAGRYQIFNQNGSGDVTFVCTTGMSENDVAYPEWWGAVHDATTDDAQEIQAALDCGIKHVSLFGGASGIDTNQYLVSTTLTLSGESMISGSSGSRIRPEIKSSAITLPILYANEVDHVSIRHLTLNYTSTPVNSGAEAILFHDVQKGVIEDIHIRTSYTGIKLEDCQTVFANNIFSSVYTGSGFHILGVTSANYDVQLTNFVFNGGAGAADNPPTLGTTGGVRIEGLNEGCFFGYGEIVLSKYALYIYSAVAGGNYGTSSGYIYFDNVYFDSAYSGSLINSAHNITFSNCWFSSADEATNPGLFIDDGDEVTVSNSTFFNCGGPGLKFDASSVGTLIYGNVITSCGQGGASPGIDIGAGADNFQIIGNRITEGAFGSPNQTYAITLGAGASEYYVITDNYLLGNGTGSFSDISTSATYNFIVDRNIVDVTDFTIASPADNSLEIPPDGNYFYITGTNNITSMSASWGSREVTLMFADILTFTDGGNLSLAGDFVTTGSDTITLRANYGGAWYEVSRSIN